MYMTIKGTFVSERVRERERETEMCGRSVLDPVS